MQKGFFVFLAGSVFFLLAFSLKGELGEQHAELERTLSALEEMEGLDFERAVLEENLGQFLQARLERELEKEGTDSLSLNRELNKGLREFLEKHEGRGDWHFFIAELTSASYDRALEAEPLPEGGMLEEELSEALVARTPAGTLGTFSWTGGLERNRVWVGKRKEGGTEMGLLIPLGYRVEGGRIG